MNSLTLEDLGLLGEEALKARLDSINNLVDFGFYVYPCFAITPFGCSCKLKHKNKKEWGKHPSGHASHKVASCDPRAKLWWIENPYDNIAINPEKSGFVVIDVDPRSGGHKSLEKFLSDCDVVLPKTVTTLTGVYETAEGESVRGFHLWFKAPENANFVQNLNHLGYEGVDVKYNGGVMAPPSRHSSGVTYEWAEELSPFEISFAELPDALTKKLTRKFRRPISVPIYEGNRVVGLHKLACRVAYRMGVETPEKAEAVLNVMLEYNASMVHPPLERFGADAAEKHILNAINWIAGQSDER
jgi:hypothetical protein